MLSSSSRGRVHDLATDTEGHLEAVHAFGLACLHDLEGQKVHEDVQQEGGEGAALPHASAYAEPLRLDPLTRHPHPVTLVKVLDEAYQLGVDARASNTSHTASWLTESKALLKSTKAACTGVAWARASSTTRRRDV